jgi:hypothetical protein
VRDFGEVRGCRGCRSRRRGVRKSRGRTGKFAGISRKASKRVATLRRFHGGWDEVCCTVGSEEFREKEWQALVTLL